VISFQSQFPVSEKATGSLPLAAGQTANSNLTIQQYPESSIIFYETIVHFFTTENFGRLKFY